MALHARTASRAHRALDRGDADVQAQQAQSARRLEHYMGWSRTTLDPEAVFVVNDPAEAGEEGEDPWSN